jgi:hypothetical protein
MSLPIPGQCHLLYFFRIFKEQPNLSSRLCSTQRLLNDALRRSVTTLLVEDERDRTDDPLLAKQVLSQLSYIPRDARGGSGWTRTIDPRLIKTVL